MSAKTSNNKNPLVVKRYQSGFTLIEIAIVLVIIGLLAASILKGQAIVKRAKVKLLTTDFINIPIYVYGYDNAYRGLPGDQPQSKLDRAFGAASGAKACLTPGTPHLCMPGNSVIDGGWDAKDASAESYVFWQHVRLARFTLGPTQLTDPNYLPVNAVGGFIGVTNVFQSPVIGMKGTFIICSDAIPGDFAKELDNQLDDGNTANGFMQVVPAGTPTATPVAPLPTNVIADNSTYLVCMGY